MVFNSPCYFGDSSPFHSIFFRTQLVAQITHKLVELSRFYHLLNLLLQVETLVGVVPLILMVVTVLVLIPSVFRGLHLRWPNKAWFTLSFIKNLWDRCVQSALLSPNTLSHLRYPSLWSHPLDLLQSSLASLCQPIDSIFLRMLSSRRNISFSERGGTPYNEKRSFFPLIRSRTAVTNPVALICSSLWAYQTPP